MLREAVILAGGFGTRLRQVVSDTCKPMAPIAGKPFLTYLLNKLADDHFDRVVLAVGYKHEDIVGYFGKSYRGMNLIYSVEDYPLGTGGALKRALSYCDEPWVVVLNGDTYCDFDSCELIDQAIASQPQTETLLLVKPIKASQRYGTLRIDEDGYILEFQEKANRDETLISLGVYVIKRTCLANMPSVFSFEKDYLQKRAGIRALQAVVTDAFFIDIGIPEDYNAAQTLLQPLIASSRLAVFDRDGTINVDTGHLHEIDKLKLIPRTLDRMRAYALDPEFKIVVITNQAGIAKGIYDEREMRELHHYMDALLAEKGIAVSAYYFCPHHPDITGECQCRKPGTALLKEAMKEFDAVPCECVMFGDKESDQKAAEAMSIPFFWAGEACSV